MERVEGPSGACGDCQLENPCPWPCTVRRHSGLSGRLRHSANRVTAARSGERRKLVMMDFQHSPRRKSSIVS